MRFEVYPGLRGGAVKPSWRWRLRASNGRIIADSGEGYVKRSAALHAIDLIRRQAPDAPIEVLDEVERA